MKKLFYSFIITVSTLLLVSCEKQVFEDGPTDKFGETDVWNSIDLVSTYMNEVYNGMGNWVTDGFGPSSMADDNYSQFNWAGELYISAGAATYLNPTTANNLGVNYNKGGSYTPDRNSTNVTGKWGYMYSKIRAINKFFNNIDKVPGDAELKDRMKGEMHFLRAYFYAQLINVYGEVPIITKEYSIEDDFTDITKSSFQEVTDFVVKECDSAIASLPISFPSEPGRATKGAAMALKAEQLLYAASPLNNGGSYDAAKLQLAKAANEAIMDLDIYSLYDPTDYRRIFLDKAHPEIIFAKYTNGALHVDRENDMELDLAPAGAGGFTAYPPLQNLVDEYEVIDGANTFIPATWNGTMRTVTSNPAYDDNNMYVNRDPRFYASILYNGATRGANGYIIESYVGGKDSRQSTVSQWWNATWSSYYVRKYSEERTDSYGNSSFFDVMWIHYRLGEIYLNQAEILFELNTTDTDGHDALWYVNQIRSRAGMPVYASLDREKIRHERRIELVFEGNRYFDTRRWMIYDQIMRKGQYGITVTKQPDGSFTHELFGIWNVTGAYDTKMLWWPIPQTEIDKNPALEQTPGW